MKKKQWFTRREAAKILRNEGKSIVLIPVDGKTSHGNKRWSRELLDKCPGYYETGGAGYWRKQLDEKGDKK